MESCGCEALRPNGQMTNVYGELRPNDVRLSHVRPRLSRSGIPNIGRRLWEGKYPQISDI